MGTSVLSSHDCLQPRLRHHAFSLSAPSVRSQTNPNPIPNSNPNHNQTRRRRLYDGHLSGMVVKGPGANLVMGQVKILKRGEKLSLEDGGTGRVDSSYEGFDLVLGSTDRLGPDPSSVPVPGFLGKRNGAAATTGLRRLLRLDLAS
ncbi:uncharacterized protein LOC113852727 [Abrus precatorius]|uniref:Uncharacterized protein LOC113852727 n=1 Tax=Abrus precatorius TaxID=3816 RepID=A0A8B8K551_ABRPR|nr:uncharacterized protein LOC113852727 [Abrus precatorius]